MNEYVNRETAAKGMWYEKKFRQFLKERKRLPVEILALAETMRRKGEEKCVGNACVRCVGLNIDDEAMAGLPAGKAGTKKIEENDILSVYFKVTIDDKKFFLKIEKRDVESEGGHGEMQDAILAKETIEELNDAKVRVVNPLLGYSDKKNRSYYVSEWEDLPLLDKILNSWQKKGQKDKVDKFVERMNKIRRILDGYREVSSNNMFYDEKKDQIVLFDMHL